MFPCWRLKQNCGFHGNLQISMWILQILLISVDLLCRSHQSKISNLGLESSIGISNERPINFTNWHVNNHRETSMTLDSWAVNYEAQLNQKPYYLKNKGFSCLNLYVTFYYFGFMMFMMFSTDDSSAVVVSSIAVETEIFCKIEHFSIKESSGGSRISRRGGRGPRTGGRGPPRRLHFKNFACQNERIWDPWGGAPGGAP